MTDNAKNQGPAVHQASPGLSKGECVRPSPFFAEGVAATANNELELDCEDLVCNGRWGIGGGTGLPCTEPAGRRGGGGGGGFFVTGEELLAVSVVRRESGGRMLIGGVVGSCSPSDSDGRPISRSFSSSSTSPEP